MNVQKMYIKFLRIYKKCTNCTKLVQTQTKNGLKLEMYVFVDKKCTNYAKLYN